MEHSRYLALIESDAAMLADAARPDLDAAVPSCPGWAVRDLVMHTAVVYRHKVACMRLQALPDPWPPQWQVDDLLTWFDDALAELLDELRTRGPDAPAYTWYPPDQTVGFWARRMAQETAVHRVDAQLAAGGVRPVDDDLAVDGVDELLVVFLGGDWSEAPIAARDGGTVAVRTSDRMWRVTSGPTSVEVVTGAGASVATVSGEPSELLLNLWNRRPDSAVRTEGDATALATFRDRLRLATQ